MKEKKHNKMTKWLILLIVGIVANFFNPQEVKAWTFVPSSNVSNFMVNKTTKKVSFSMVLYRERSTGDDNNLQRVSIRIQGQSYFQILCKDYDLTTYNNADFNFTLYGQDEDSWGITYAPTYCNNLIITTTQVGDFTYGHFEFDLAESHLFDETYELVLYNLVFDDDDGSDFYQLFYTAPIIDGWENIVLNSFTASNDNCSQVNLNWSVSGYSSDIYYRVKVDGSTITTAQNITSYIHNLGNPEPVANSFELIAGYGTALKRNQTSTESGGPPRTGYNNVSNFLATDHTCDKIELTWDASVGANTLRYNIYTSGVEPITVNEGEETYTITDPEERDYSFTIKSENECGFESSGKNTSSSKLTLTAPSSISTTILASGSIRLDWTAASGHDSYYILKTYPGGSETINNIDKNLTTYTDDNINICTTYKYEIYSKNDCNPDGAYGGFALKRITPDLTNTFTTNILEVSKGYFTDKVQLTWTANNNATIIENWEIYRREYGGTWALINTVNQNQNLYSDQAAEAGVLYEYKIIGNSNCEGTTIYSNEISELGFKSPTGIINGRVDYTGGIAVENVKIIVGKSTGITGTSLYFDGSSNVSIPHNSNLTPSSNITIEAWIRPSQIKTNNFIISN